MRFLRALALFVLLALASFGALASASDAAPISTPPSDCSASFDPYAYTPSALAACGIQTFPLTDVTSLPGGGTSYNYDEGNGIVVHQRVPPQGFDPTTATPDQLTEYGLPPRPTDIGQLAKWQHLMSTGQATPPPQFVVVLPNVRADTTYSKVWSGYAVTAASGTFYEAETEFNEPGFGSSFCTTNAEVTWGGFGGYYNDGLEQDGTSHNVPGLANHQAWYEVWPLQNISPLSLTTSTGHDIDAETIKNSSTEFNFFVADYTANTSTGRVVDVPSGYYSGTSAEAIAERPTINGTPSNLSNFGTLTFTGAWGNYTGLNSWSPTGGRHGVWMTNTGTSGGTVMANPGNIGSGGSFSDTQHSCQ